MANDKENNRLQIEGLHPDLRVKLADKIGNNNLIELSVFVVDDNKYFPLFIANHLKKFETILNKGGIHTKFKVKKFYNGKDCLKSLKSEPDLIFLDYYLNVDSPKNVINGDVIFHEVNSYYPDTKVVMLGTPSSVSEIQSLAKYGLKQVVLKDDYLLENIDRVILESIGAININNLK